MRRSLIEISRDALFCAALAAAVPSCNAKDARATGPAQVSMSFNLTIPAGEHALQSSLTPTESTRRTFYQLVAAECEVLLATIAATCQLTNASVNISEQRHNQQSPYTQINGSGNFAITLKPNQ